MNDENDSADDCGACHLHITTPLLQWPCRIVVLNAVDLLTNNVFLICVIVKVSNTIN